MNPRDLAKLAYRLLGILALLYSTTLLSDVWTLTYLVMGDHNGLELSVPIVMTAQLLPFLLLVGGGIVLIARAQALANRTVGEREGSTSFTAVDLHSTLFSTAGIVLIGLSVVQLPRVIHNFAVASSAYVDPDTAVNVRFESWLWMTGVILQFSLGVFLVFRGSSLVTLLRRRFDRAKIVAADGRCPHCGFWFETGSYRPDAAVYLCSNCKQELPRKLIAPSSG